MASVVESKIKNCNEGPAEKEYIGSCAYEFACFADCTMGHVTPSLTRPMARYATGWIATYSSGTPPVMTGTRFFKPWEILGGPVSDSIEIGLVGANWQSYFVGDPNANPPVRGPGSGWTMRWWDADHQNGFPAQHRVHLAKFILIEYYWVKESDFYSGNLDGAGNKIIKWTCPSKSTNKPAPAPTTTWGNDACPRYYELTPCTDCYGTTQNVKKTYWEMKDKQQITDPLPFPGVGQYPIVEWPRGSKLCYKFRGLSKGPKGDWDWNKDPDKGEFIQVHTHLDTYDQKEACTECKMDYFLAITKVKDLDDPVPAVGFWDAEVIIGALGNPDPVMRANIQQGIISGKVAFRRMKKTPQHTAFYNANPVFFYKGGNGVCYKAAFLTPAQISAFPGSCVPAGVFDFTRWGGGPPAQRQASHSYISRNMLGQVWVVDGACECAKSPGDIGNGNQYDICFPLDPPPMITTSPSDFTVKVSTAIPAGDADFSVTATAASANRGPITYQWQSRRGGNWTDISGATGRTLTVANQMLPDNHNPPGTVNYVRCIVSNNAGKKSVTSGVAKIFVVWEPYILYPGQNVYLATVEIYCLTAKQCRSLLTQSWVQRTVTGTQTLQGLPFSPATGGAITATATRTMYFDPNLISPDPNSGAYVDPNVLGGCYHIYAFQVPPCSGFRTVYKVTNVRIVDWETGVPSSCKDKQPPSLDESVDSKFVLSDQGILPGDWDTTSTKRALGLVT